MKLWERLATLVGDTWITKRAVAVWPWPAILVGSPHSRFTWQDYRHFTSKMQSGDFIVTQSAPFFGSNAAISGTAFKHGAVYVGPVSGNLNRESRCIESPACVGLRYRHTGIGSGRLFERSVVHAISDGVVCQDVGELLFHADYAMVVRPWTTDAERRAIIVCALSACGREYDFSFNHDDSMKVFCTELCTMCAESAGIRLPKQSLKRVSLLKPLVPVVLADSVAVAYKPVCCSESCLDSAFQNQSALDGKFVDAIQKAWKEQ